MTETKEVRIFYDTESNIALVRIFKLRNYRTAGGKVYEVKRGSRVLEFLANIICGNNESMNKSSILWQDGMDTAVSYFIDMEKTFEK